MAEPDSRQALLYKCIVICQQAYHILWCRRWHLLDVVVGAIGVGLAGFGKVGGAGVGERDHELHELNEGGEDGTKRTGREKHKKTRTRGRAEVRQGFPATRPEVADLALDCWPMTNSLVS